MCGVCNEIMLSRNCVCHKNMKNLSWKSQNVEKSKIEDLDMKEC